MGNSESSHSTKTLGEQPPQFPRLSSPPSAIKPHYDVVIVGSGYGASIAASRCARAGQKVCVLERGKEWLPGEFPETFSEASKEVQISFGGKKHIQGKSSNLYEFVVTENVTVIQGCGLGGGSLINANVGLDSDPDVFSDPVWPQELRDDLKNFTSVDRQHVLDMLKPTPYPDHYPKLHKLERMKEGLCEFDIEDTDKMFYKPPLYVTFEDTPANHVGIPQPKCTACGNCVGGCNVGAKNTLNMNYLPDAKAHGAKIFTEVEVIAVTKACDSSDWLVSYRRQHTGCFDVDEQIVRASHVILGAGALGSTKILLRSKERGLDVSEQLGKRFTTNGDALGFSYNGDKKANAIGIKTKKESDKEDKKNDSDEPPGPTITSVMDFRKTLGGDFKDHFVIEDGTPPSIASVPYTLGVSVGAKVLGEDKFPSEEKVEKVFQELQGKGMDNTLSFLCMSHDDAGGQITFDKSHDNTDIEWKEVGRGPNFDRVNERVNGARL